MPRAFNDRYFIEEQLALDRITRKHRAAAARLSASIGARGRWHATYKGYEEAERRNS